MKTAIFRFLFLALIPVGHLCFAVSYVGLGGGDIPDSSYTGANPPVYDAAPLVLSFSVTNLPGTVQSVSLSITLRHQWLGDLDVRLSSPSNADFPGTNFVIFSHCGGADTDQYGNRAFLGAVNMANDTMWATNWGTYVFADSGKYSLREWTDVNWGGFNPGLSYTIPSGTYRTSSIGLDDQPTSFATNSGFIGMLPAHANGTWLLEFRDGSNASTGSVQSATLELGVAIVTPPKFSSITLSNGLVVLHLNGPANQGFRLYSSTNLMLPVGEWTQAGTGAFDPVGNAVFMTNSPEAGCYFSARMP